MDKMQKIGMVIGVGIGALCWIVFMGILIAVLLFSLKNKNGRDVFLVVLAINCNLIFGCAIFWEIRKKIQINRECAKCKTVKRKKD